MLHHDRERLSQRLRIAGRRAPIAQVDVGEPVLIRYSRDEDWPALERLGALNSRTLAAGSFLLAEVDGELVAAAPLDLDEEPLSDPFRPTASLLELLRLRADQVRSSRDVLARRAGPTSRTLGEAA
jgi:hypothetical protein